jgi:trans-aconitate 2-methyltransferase
MPIWNAQDYEKNSSAQQQWAQELIAKLDLQGHEQILDLGCGDGKVTADGLTHVEMIRLEVEAQA